MDPISLIWRIKELFPLEVALTLGIVFWAVSWCWPRRIITLPTAGSRVRFLTRLCIWGGITVLTVGTLSSFLVMRRYFPEITGFDGWWQRAAPLLAAAAVVAVSAAVLARTPRPLPGERAIAPHRRWWAFAPLPALWIAAGAGALTLLTALWHTLIGVSAPADGLLFGNVPATETDLPVFFRAFGGVAYIAGAGWPNHLCTILAVGVAAVALILVLRADSNRPSPVSVSPGDVRAERSATARLLTLIVLGGVLLTLGALWAHVGFAGTVIAGSDFVSGDRDAPVRPADLVFLGTDYQAIAGPMARAGYLVQGLGAALLLRLVSDTIRAARARRRTTPPAGPTASAAASALDVSLARPVPARSAVSAARPAGGTGAGTGRTGTGTGNGTDAADAEERR